MELLLASIQALLSAPNPDDPLAENIAKHWKSNEAEAVETGECSLSISGLGLRRVKFFIVTYTLGALYFWRKQSTGFTMMKEEL